MKNLNLKTFIPALVAAGCLVYESFTNHQISASLQKVIADDVITGIGVIGTVWGFIKDHRKG